MSTIVLEAAIIAVLLCPAGASAKHVIRVLPELQYQRIEGFGQGNMDQANVPWFGRLSQEERERLLDDLHTLKDGGLGLNVCRTYIWGGDDPTHEHMWRGPGSKKCIGFEIRPGHFVWEGHDASLWHPRGAMKRGALMVAFWNSPPYWMTVSGCSSGSKTTGENNLRDDMIERFAEHMCKMLIHYRDGFGIPFKYVCPINEPEVGWWTVKSGQEGCNMDSVQARRLFPALAEALRRHNLDIGIQGPEAAASASIKYLDELLGDAATNGAIDVLTCHQYMVDERSLYLWARRARRAGKPLWMSEWGDWKNKGMKLATNYADKIHQAHRAMRTSVWCMWEPNFLFDEKDGRLSRRAAFYAVGHYSRFLRGDTRIVEAVSPLLKLNAYVNEQRRRLVIVAVNDTDKNLRVHIDLSAFTGMSRIRCWRTSEDEHMKELPALGPERTVHVVLNRESVLTMTLGFERIEPCPIVNPGFETGDLTGWTAEATEPAAAGVEDNYPRGGYFDAFLHPKKTSGALIRQTVKGLNGGGNYVLGAECATSGIAARLGVKLGGRELTAEARGGGYALKTIEFTAPTDGIVEIFFDSDAAGGDAHHWATIDNVFLRRR